MVQVFSELFSSLGSFAGSDDYLFGFTFLTIGVVGLVSGILKAVKI